MASLQDLRCRIQPANHTQQVTKGMSLPYRTLSDWSR